jgi:hypothetical protein
MEINGLRPKLYTSTSHQDGMSLKMNKKYRRNRRHLRLRSSKQSEKEQKRDVKHSNTKEPSVSSDKARATAPAKNAIGQSNRGIIDSQHNPVITRSGRASKPP